MKNDTGSDTKKDLIGHLKFYSDLGVTHIQLGEIPSLFKPEEKVEESVALESIRSDLGDCIRCKLHSTRKNIVFGAGNPNADLMFVGEAPGFDEDVQGEPFVGRAGRLLTRIIEAIDLRREDVYIANILKCRPPNNRDPQPDEIDVCQPFLFKQIDSIQPVVLVALGKYAAQTLLKSKVSISRLRGKFHKFRSVLLMPTFHPSYLLRNPSAKRLVWEDMKMVRETLRKFQEPKGR